jgi:hypothetical protein
MRAHRLLDLTPVEAHDSPRESRRLLGIATEGNSIHAKPKSRPAFTRSSGARPTPASART